MLAAMRRGEHLIACDEAEMVVAMFPGSLQARYLKVLALARSGAADRAAAELEACGFDGTLPSDTPPALAEDIAALGARLAKDKALLASGPARTAQCLDAAERYEAVYRRYGRPYSCINAATMYFLAGEIERAATLAHATQRLLAEQPPEDDSYWSAVTDAEAALLIDEPVAAAAALERAALAPGGDYAARASTRRQLGLIQHHRNREVDILDLLPVPAVIHYCGHRVRGKDDPRWPAHQETRIFDEIGAYMCDHDVGFAYGSLASGVDILVAEAAIRAGAELHVLLPYAMEEFIAESVAPGGASWVERFHGCVQGATTVSTVDPAPYLGDEVAYEYCSQVAMGRALIRAESLTGRVEQLAVWDGLPAPTGVGTGADVDTWTSRGLRSHIISPDDPAQPCEPPAAGTAAQPAHQRELRAMLFADFKGFSSLHDRHMAIFVEVVLSSVAVVLAAHGEAVLNRRTWGDGLHVVFTGVAPAARCALDLQDAMSAIDWTSAGFPHRLGLRIGAHVGPVMAVTDPVAGARDFTGTHIVRTARIEPRTPEGDVYVTEPFAALLALDRDATMSCQYVGHIPTAKDYGTFPMFVLKRT